MGSLTLIFFLNLRFMIILHVCESASKLNVACPTGFGTVKEHPDAVNCAFSLRLPCWTAVFV